MSLHLKFMLNIGCIFLANNQWLSATMVSVQHAPCVWYGTQRGKKTPLFLSPSLFPRSTTAVYSEKHLHFNYSTSWGLNKISLPRTTTGREPFFSIAVLKYVQEFSDACMPIDCEPTPASLQNNTLFYTFADASREIFNFQAYVQKSLFFFCIN